MTLSAQILSRNACWHLSIDCPDKPHLLRRLLEALGEWGTVLALHLHTDDERRITGLELQFRSEASHQALMGLLAPYNAQAWLALLPPFAPLLQYQNLLKRWQSPTLSKVLLEQQALSFTELSHCLLPPSQEHPDPAADAPPAPLPVGQFRSRETFQHVRTDHLERLLGLIGELQATSSGLRMMARQREDELLETAMDEMHYLVQRLKRATAKVCLIPTGNQLRRHKRLVQEMAEQLDREAQLLIQGEDTEASRSLLEKLHLPLAVFYRYLVTFLLEAPSQRKADGKHRRGSISVTAELVEEQLQLVFEHDFDGERWPFGADFPDSQAPLGLLQLEQECRQWLHHSFAPGKVVPALALLARVIRLLQGRIEVGPQTSQGGRFLIQVPAMTALATCLWLRCGEDDYLVPKEVALECVEVDPAWTQKLTALSTIRLRNEALPCFRLDHFLHQGQAGNEELMLIIEFGRMKAALLVNEFQGELEVVAKPLPSHLTRFGVYDATAILPNGKTALILEVPRLLQQVLQKDKPEDDSGYGSKQLH